MKATTSDARKWIIGGGGLAQDPVKEVKTWQILGMWALTIPAGLILGYINVHILILANYTSIGMDFGLINFEGSWMLMIMPLIVGVLFGLSVGERIEIPMLIGLSLAILAVASLIVSFAYFSPIIFGMASSTGAYHFRTVGWVFIQLIISAMPLMIGTLGGGIVVSE